MNEFYIAKAVAIIDKVLHERVRNGGIAAHKNPTARFY
jgi:hypothetical protein